MLEVEELFEDFEDWYLKVEEKIKETSNKFNYIILGGIFGIFANMIRISGDLIAILLYPGYNPTTHMISFLASSLGHVYFTFGLIFCAILIIPYYFSVAIVFKNEFSEDKMLIHRSLQVSIISAISLSLVGFFLELSIIIPHPLIYDFHGFFAAIAFMSAVFYCLVMGSLIQKSIYFPRFFAYAYYIVGGVSLIFLFTWHALIEWLASSLVIILQLSFGVYMIYKKVKSKQYLSEYRAELNKLLINKFLMNAISE